MYAKRINRGKSSPRAWPNGSYTLVSVYIGCSIIAIKAVGSCFLKTKIC